VAKRTRTPRKPAAAKRRSRPPRRDRRRDEPDLIDRIAAALTDEDPLAMLGLASTLLAGSDPRGRNPFTGPAQGPSREELVESLLGVPLPETSALLAAGSAPL
jgi:hypothetical protein